MTDQILVILQDIVRSADKRIIDECPRRDSEPFISIWEVAKGMVADRTSLSLHDPASRDSRIPDHASSNDIIARLQRLLDCLSEEGTDGRGMYGEIIDIRNYLRKELSFT